MKMELYQKILQIKLINIFQLKKLIKVIGVLVIKEYTNKKKIFNQHKINFSFKLKKNHQVIQSLV
jgi:hypothetical protein